MAFTKLLSRMAFYICCMSLFMTIPSCRQASAHVDEADRNNSIYYWRTTFSLDDAEKMFLDKHDIGKIYMRFFDVVCPPDQDKGESVIPDATIQFLDSIPKDIEIVPTVYITTSAINAIQTKEDEYAEKIIRRVDAICRRHKIDFKELQLDCDWTKSTRRYFFRLCEAIRQRLDSTQSLSSTIRLHQLTQSPPPVDKGVLMVYNTGNLMEMTTDNSIFSLSDIRPYLRDDRLSKYPLPLDVAYPAYGWSVAYYPSGEGYRFFRLMRRTDLQDYPALHKIGTNLYEATADVDFSDGKEIGDCVYKNYRIRVERPSADEIMEVKRLIDRKLSGKPHNNILYHLDNSQLSHYSDHEISNIYSRD